jgi:hypothetical protein
MVLSLRMVCNLDSDDEIIAIDSTCVGINLYCLAKHEPSEIALRANEIRLRYKPMTENGQPAPVLDRSTFWLADYIGNHIDRPELTNSFLSNIRHAVAKLVSCFHDQSVTTYPDVWPAEDYRRSGVIRYGNVELRVLENYLTDEASLRQAMATICTSSRDEQYMYRDCHRSSFLSASDVELNLRMLMTNAGLYTGVETQAAWDCLEFWCKSYAEAIKMLPLAAFPPAYPFFFNVQRSIWEVSAIKKAYVVHPGILDFYRFAEGRKLLVVSPLATMISSQVESGNTRSLLKTHQLPELSVETVEAPVSTFPNKPHGSWLESFQLLTDQIDKSFSRSPSAAFAASCGAYGLPLCGYVAKKYSIPVFYVGNILHAYFGILQNATINFMQDERNEMAWIRGNLSRFQNIEKIDSGRYV